MTDQPTRREASSPDLRALQAITDAVEAGAGLPEILRASARALDTSLILIDRSGAVLAVAARGARSVAPGSISAPSEQDAAEVVLLVPDPDGETGRRATAAVIRELESGLPGFAFALGRSRHAADPLAVQRAGNEALLAANVVEGAPERSQLAYEETGTYQLLLPHMNDPAELQRFYDGTVRPLVAYDEQYETDLLGTLSTFLDCDANVNATAARLITHRH